MPLPVRGSEVIPDSETAQVREQEALTRQIIETIPMRVFWKDRQSRYLGCNTAFAQDAAVDRPSDLVGKTDVELTWREQADAYRGDDRLVIESGQSKLSFDEPQTTPDGSVVWLRTSKVPLRNEHREIIGVLGVYEDITVWKQTELALQESEQRFRMAFETSGIGMALVATDGRFLKVNAALREILGYSEDELLARRFQDITYPDDLASDLAFVEQLLGGDLSHYQLEKRYWHKDGHAVWTRLNVALVRNGSGEPVHFVSQVDDISEEKRGQEHIERLNDELEQKVRERTQQLQDAQESLVRKEKLAVLGQVAGSVGHELRNPLGVMNNAVYFLQTVLSDADATTREYLGIIKDEIANANRIVSDLLDSVRTKPPHREPTDPRWLIEQSLRTCSIPASVTVSAHLPDALPALTVDKLQLQQVFRNLITNAVEAMPGGGTLDITAERLGASEVVRLSVTDSGCGLTADARRKLFQPLFTTKARGIGLGLIVVKNLTEANGGTIGVESVAGAGTTFTLMLPVEPVV